ncbi:MAG: hypothetical protein O3B02_02175 [Proteobacteria bacterium]|nr:hypothetical protein [Pseudomonadota bacterium]MDA0895500.1 hypothetical protein [Pseudomonadota bacterium]MDA1243793.1 hypothetical protein [Pseudomonadota bacterium]
MRDRLLTEIPFDQLDTLGDLVEPFDELATQLAAHAVIAGDAAVYL